MFFHFLCLFVSIFSIFEQTWLMIRVMILQEDFHHMKRLFGIICKTQLMKEVVQMQRWKLIFWNWKLPRLNQWRLRTLVLFFLIFFWILFKFFCCVFLIIFCTLFFVLFIVFLYCVLFFFRWIALFLVELSFVVFSTFRKLEALCSDIVLKFVPDNDVKELRLSDVMIYKLSKWKYISLNDFENVCGIEKFVWKINSKVCLDILLKTCHVWFWSEVNWKHVDFCLFLFFRNFIFQILSEFKIFFFWFLKYVVVELMTCICANWSPLKPVVLTFFVDFDIQRMIFFV